jgi:ABC-type amino acid transport substrate-binding protein
MLRQIPLAVLLCCAAGVEAGCPPVRIGYIDQDRPPYWLGSGNEVAEPAGVGVDYLRATAAATIPCPIQFVRMPSTRLRVALQAGEVDYLPIEERPDLPPDIVLPRDRNGVLDRSRALHTSIIVLVRAADQLAPDTITPRYFQGKVMGVPYGAPYTDALRAAGIRVDDGGRDLERNIGKLRLKRVDGIALTVGQLNDMDQSIAERYGNEIVRLRVPLFSSNIWLATNPAYYAAHKEQVEAVWTWMATHQNELSGIMAKYSRK